ncbi:WbqC-like protein [Leptospira kirschneri str. 200803703]|uniref:WbqC-like protein n=4 Tax=Leptospira TaxID=171 RepID=M3F8D0_LEPBO|nr:MULTISPECIES: WbqC family protein [Leptospira]EMF98167.1 WbqC-like protein [Leptospira borgpetersenii str. 200701203]EKO53282.1 WbqC-like protein [Leptospira kirschneri str. 200802841]EKP11949.1 WbqC-like protein [Leptospira borgpetersenii str. 200801926]EMN12977.1 WbqC-like protein [Leptospira borgpetersenii str. Brem 307]EMN16535.1 WbqC-like protein [Leptospira borgpetersenii str. Brem 328]
MIGVILQPNYIPWRGYFELIGKADVFVFLDDVQYTNRDWRNRNQIKTQTGLQWLTIPVFQTSKFGQLIHEVEIDNSSKWYEKHLNAITRNYSKASFFKKFDELLEILYSGKLSSLSDLDILSIEWIARYLELNTKFIRASQIVNEGTRQEKLISICKEVGITTYISGPSAKSYIVPENFEKDGISLLYQEYNYPNYPQLYGDFVGNVSILDLLFNCGFESRKYIFKE